MPIPLPGDGRPVLTLDELLEALQDVRARGGAVAGRQPVWVAGVPPLYLPVSNVRVMAEGPDRVRIYVDVLR